MGNRRRYLHVPPPAERPARPPPAEPEPVADPHEHEPPHPAARVNREALAALQRQRTSRFKRSEVGAVAGSSGAHGGADGTADDERTPSSSAVPPTAACLSAHAARGDGDTPAASRASAHLSAPTDARPRSAPPLSTALSRVNSASELSASGDTPTPPGAVPSFFPRLSGQRIEDLVKLVMHPLPLELTPAFDIMPPLPCLPLPTDPGPLELDPIAHEMRYKCLHREVLEMCDGLAANLPQIGAYPPPRYRDPDNVGVEFAALHDDPLAHWLASNGVATAPTHQWEFDPDRPHISVPDSLFCAPLPTPAQLQAQDLLALPPDPKPELPDDADDADADGGADAGADAGSDDEAEGDGEAPEDAGVEADAEEDDEDEDEDGEGGGSGSGSPRPSGLAGALLAGKLRRKAAKQRRGKDGGSPSSSASGLGGWDEEGGEEIEEPIGRPPSVDVEQAVEQAAADGGAAGSSHGSAAGSSHGSSHGSTPLRKRKWKTTGSVLAAAGLLEGLRSPEALASGAPLQAEAEEALLGRAPTPEARRRLQAMMRAASLGVGGGGGADGAEVGESADELEEGEEDDDGWGDDGWGDDGWGEMPCDGLQSSTFGEGYDDEEGEREGISSWSKSKVSSRLVEGVAEGVAEAAAAVKKPRPRDDAMKGALAAGKIALDEAGRYTKTPYVMDDEWNAMPKKMPRPEGSPRNVASLVAASAVLGEKRPQRAPWVPPPQLLADDAEEEDAPRPSIPIGPGTQLGLSVTVSRPGSASAARPGAEEPPAQPPATPASPTSLKPKRRGPPPPQPPQSPAMSGDEDFEPSSSARGARPRQPSPHHPPRQPPPSPHHPPPRAADADHLGRVRPQPPSISVTAAAAVPSPLPAPPAPPAAHDDADARAASPTTAEVGLATEPLAKTSSTVPTASVDTERMAAEPSAGERAGAPPPPPSHRPHKATQATEAEEGEGPAAGKAAGGRRRAASPPRPPATKAAATAAAGRLGAAAGPWEVDEAAASNTHEAEKPLAPPSAASHSPEKAVPRAPPPTPTKATGGGAAAHTQPTSAEAPMGEAPMPPLVAASTTKPTTKPAPETAPETAPVASTSAVAPVGGAGLEAALTAVAASDAAVALVARLQQLWGALGVPEAERLKCLQRRAPVESSAAAHAASEAELEKAVALWSEATDAVLKREDALVHLALFAQKALAPERLLDRRAAGASALHEHVLDGAEGLSTLPEKYLSLDFGKKDMFGRSLEGAGAAAGGKPAAWLLRESKLRDGLQFNVDRAEARLLVALPRLEASGDAMWLHGERYRDKMRHDQQSLLQHVLERNAAQRAEEARAVEPFAPPGRPAALSPRVANEMSAHFELRTAAPPWAAPQRSAAAPPRARHGAALSARPASSRPATSSSSPRSAFSSTEPSQPATARSVASRPATSQSHQMRSDGPPTTLTYQRPSTAAPSSARVVRR